MKNDVAFALLTAISLHIITMLNEINNFHGLDVIFNGEPIGLGNCASWKCGNNIGESNCRGDDRS